MNETTMFRYALSITAAVALFSGCGGFRSVGGPSVDAARIPLSRDHRESKRPRGTSDADLLYLADGGNRSGLIVYSYPTLKKVGEVAVDGFGLCSDERGDVFVPTYSSGGLPVIQEYAHGGTQSIATLSEYRDDSPVGCSVDPKTGNLAVTNNDGNNYYGCSGQGNVAIFAHAQGQPTTYCTGPAVKIAFACGYDDAENLYVDGQPTVESHALRFGVLHRGSKSFSAIILNRRLEYPRAVQWDGSYITIETAGGSTAPKILAVQVSGSKGRVVRATDFENIKSEGAFGLSWIRGTRVIVPGAWTVGFFSYPSGGRATRRLTSDVGKHPLSVTVSAAAP